LPTVAEDGREAIADAHDGAHVQLRCDVSDSVVDVAVRLLECAPTDLGAELTDMTGLTNEQVFAELYFSKKMQV
jgi:hypothetical protein